MIPTATPVVHKDPASGDRDFLKIAMVIVVVACLLAGLLINVLAPQQYRRLTGFALAALAAALTLLELQRGNRTRAYRWLTYCAWFGISVSAAINGGMTSPAILAYPMLILVAGWLMGTRTVLALTAMSLAAEFAFVADTSAHWLPTQLPAPPSWVLLSHTLILSVSASLALFIRRSFAARFAEIARRDEELLARHELYRALLDAQSSAGIGMFIIENGRIVYSNEAFCRIVGFSDKELLALPSFITLTHPDDRERVMNNHRRRLAGEQFENRYDIGVLRKDGERREAEITVTGLPDAGAASLLVIVVDITARRHTENMMREIVEGTSRATGDEFFRALVCHLARAFRVPFALVGEVRPTDPATLHTLAFWTGDGYAAAIDYDLANTPCGQVFAQQPRLFDRDLPARFPQAACMMQAGGADSYYGYPLTSAAGDPLGVLAVLDVRPLEVSEEDASMMSIFATRAAAELERQRAEAEIRGLNAELEERVRSRTAELTEANYELESFAYSISHDLRAPLRGIDGFSRLLQEEYGERLDPQGREYLTRVRRAAQRLGTLIDDLLELSRVTRQEMRRARVDLSALAADIVEHLRKAEPERTVAVSIAPHCIAQGDPQLLRVLLENLLGNAWKYSRYTENASIGFGGEATPEELRYFVRDNGAGFDMAYSDKLFVPFQRLHNPTEFEGSGIGLASAARAVRRHGGRIWAESRPGAGATFYFTLAGRG